MKISFRKATQLDYSYCYQLTKRNMLHYFNKHWGGWKPQAFRDGFIPRDTIVIINHNKRAGYYSLKISSNTIYIDNIQLSSSIQRKGVGTQVLEKVKKQAIRAKKEKLRLSVFKENPALQLYKKFGFRKIEDQGSTLLLEKKL